MSRSTLLAHLLPARHSLGRRIFSCIAAGVLGLTIITTAAVRAQSPSSPADFFKSIVGDWIGTCEQSTNGEKAENKYFHVTIKQVNPSTFDSKFEYYRLDTKTNKPLIIGTSAVTTTVAADGTVKNKITGKGTILVENKPKNQQHELIEVLTSAAGSGIKGAGTGKISVSGLPFGVGKNGKVQNGTSTWTLNNGVLSINQNIKATFRALFVNKSFNVAARYTAYRGTDVAGLMSKQARAGSTPAASAGGQ